VHVLLVIVFAILAPRQRSSWQPLVVTRLLATVVETIRIAFARRANVLAAAALNKWVPLRNCGFFGTLYNYGTF
jgi:hypothetical protein